MDRDERVVEGARLGGSFEIGEGRTVLGELTIAGAATSLYLHDQEFFLIRDEAEQGLRGILHDRTKVTVLGSSIHSELGSATRYDQSFNFAELAPGYIVSGSRHLSSSEAEISKITFHIDDAETVFHDFDAMGRVVDPRPLIKAVVGANEKWINRKIPTGPDADIAFFAGRTELASVLTAVGLVRIFHRPSPSRPLATCEVGIRNRTLIEIGFEEPRLLTKALDAVMSVLRFVNMLAGRPQNIDGIWLDTVHEGPRSPLDLYWTHRPIRPSEWEERRPHPVEILIPIVDDPEQFARVLERWLAADAARQDARVRFSNGFEQQRSFPIDRMVGAANMFDILPDDAFPASAPISQGVAEAKATAKRAFKSLPSSPERESVLNALGRIGRPTLRSKVRHRAEHVSCALREPLAHLDDVTDEAVRCRNHYVHGSPGSFDYSEHGGTFTFLAGALEFLFAASDLIDAGWDIAAWRSRGRALAHPFSRILHSWDVEAERLRALRDPALEFKDGGDKPA
jgi:hypothetical protein